MRLPRLKELDPYQVEGANWLAKNSRPVLYLADQMRVGKTPQVAAACGLVGAQRVLVDCPAIVRGGWLSEFQNFCPDRDLVRNAVRVYSRADAEKITERTRLVIVSYDLSITPDVFSALYSWAMIYGIDVLVLDEAHYLKEKESKRTQVVLGPRCTGAEALAEFAKRTWWVSGTPMPNDPSELFPFMRQAGIWPQSKSDLIRKFCFGHHDGYEFKITGSKNLPALKKLLAPVTLRRLRSDVSKATIRIGSVTIEPREVDPTRPILDKLMRQEPRYAKVVREALAEKRLDKIVVTRTKKGWISENVVSTTRRLIGWAKVAGTAELIAAELEANPMLKIAVFGIHRDPLRYLRAELRKFDPFLLFGGMAPRVRERMIASFRDNHKRRLFIANMYAAGVGIPLDVADQVWIFEASWTPVDNAQAISRIINIREPRPKEAFFVGLAGSIDDAVTRTYERKARDIETLYSAV
jgi:SWI/SNF-related matrix-associated actin-dependent regulator 1 of chromatin subfamily A